MLMLSQTGKTQWLIDNVIQQGIINLTANTITPIQAQMLNRKQWSNSTKLILGGCDIDDETFDTLLKGDYKKLNTLSLWNNRVTEKAIKALSLTNWNKITHMTLSHNEIGSKGCLYLTQCSLKELISLRIGSGKVQNEGFLHLSKGKWPRLQNLDLNNNLITDDGIRSFSKSQLQRTKLLNIGSNRCKNTGFSFILTSHLPKLSEIFMKPSGQSDPLPLKSYTLFKASSLLKTPSLSHG